MLPILRFLLLVGIALGVSACSATIFRLERAAEAPMEKVATILVSHVALRYVDDRIFDLCGFEGGTCGVQILPGKHKLRFNVFTSEVARERGRGPNRNSLHNQVSRLKFEQSVELQEGKIYELRFNESTMEKFKKKPYPIETIKFEVEKSITFKAYEGPKHAKLFDKIKKSKIIRTSEYRPDV